MVDAAVDNLDNFVVVAVDIDLDLDKKIRVVAVVDSQDSLVAVVDAVVDKALILLKVDTASFACYLWDMDFVGMDFEDILLELLVDIQDFVVVVDNQVHLVVDRLEDNPLLLDSDTSL